MKKGMLFIVLSMFSLATIGVFYNACSERSVSVSASKGTTNNNFSNTINLPGGGVVKTVKIQGTDLVVTGEKLDTVQSVQVSGGSANIAFNIIQKSTDYFIARASTNIALTFGTIYNMLVSTASAQSAVPIQAVVNPGSCADDEILQGYNTDGTLKCRKIANSIVNFTAPTRFTVTNGTITTPQIYKLCVLARQQSVLNGTCEVERLATGNWKLTCAGANVAISVEYPVYGGTGSYSGTNGGSANGAMYCFN